MLGIPFDPFKYSGIKKKLTFSNPDIQYPSCIF